MSPARVSWLSCTPSLSLLLSPSVRLCLLTFAAVRQILPEGAAAWTRGARPTRDRQRTEVFRAASPFASAFLPCPGRCVQLQCLLQREPRANSCALIKTTPSLFLLSSPLLPLLIFSLLFLSLYFSPLALPLPLPLPLLSGGGRCFEALRISIELMPQRPPSAPRRSPLLHRFPPWLVGAIACPCRPRLCPALAPFSPLLPANSHSRTAVQPVCFFCPLTSCLLCVSLIPDSHCLSLAPLS